jgi:hypothetical protein
MEALPQRHSMGYSLPHSCPCYDNLLLSIATQGVAIMTSPEFELFGEQTLLDSDRMKKYTLVLDIDDTLLRSSVFRNNTVLDDPGYQLGAEYLSEHRVLYECASFTAIVHFREDLTTFLLGVSRWFNIGFWSAGNREYVNAAVQLIYNHVGPELPPPVFVLNTESLYWYQRSGSQSYNYAKPFDHIPSVILQEQPHIDKRRMILLDDRPSNSFLNGDQMIVVPLFLKAGSEDWLELHSLSHIIDLVIRIEMQAELEQMKLKPVEK